MNQKNDKSDDIEILDAHANDANKDVSKTFNDLLMENSNDKIEDKNKLEDKTIVNNTNSNANITDDQYFDDFFQDE